MIDHEVRVITPGVKEALKNKLSSETILNKKISFSGIRKKFFIKSYENYLKRAKKVKGILIRGLPINNKKIYFDQENSLLETSKIILRNIKRKLIIKQIIQIPNPDIINLKDFENLISKKKNIAGFELISSWHNKNTDEKKYFKFYSLINEINLPLSIEVDYFFRKSKNSIYRFYNLIRYFPNIEYWLPHLGCGIFLHWNKIISICSKKPSLLTSTSNIDSWLKILNLNNFKDIPLKYATDHPFNLSSSLKIYNSCLKLKHRL
jgi:hypothetical protein